MTNFGVEFLGCKISQTDAQTVEDALSSAGHVNDKNNANVRVVNTCCVTGEAERKSRRQVRRAVDSAGDKGKVFVTGCGASNNPSQYEDISEQVTVLPGAASLAANAIVEAADTLSGLGCRGPLPGIAPGHTPNVKTKRSRAFVKVQDGCDFHCSYCIVPTVRGEPRSRSVASIVSEVERRVKQGQSEIVLTGVNIGLYRDQETRIGLDKLLYELSDVDGVSRIRISSIESNHVNKRLVAAMAENPKVCNHLHIPMQSGDDAVLKYMARHYNADKYRRSVEAARSVISDLNITTDVIVGHPGEDDAAFMRTLDLVTELGFTKIHAFPFSARPGTPAADDPNQVPKHIKTERGRILREQGDKAAIAFRKKRVGSQDQVLVETRNVAGYGAAAGVLLTDGHVALGDNKVSNEASSSMRTGYTKDYSPAILYGLSEDVSDGDIVDVYLSDLNNETGVLDANVLSTVSSHV